MTAARLVATAALASALVAWDGAASGSTFDVFGFHPRGLALGGAMSAPVDDYTATYYNPAAITVPKQVSFGAGLTLTTPLLAVDRIRQDPDFPTVLPDTHAGVSFGWLYPLGGIFKDKLALSIAGYLPATRIVRVEGIDPQLPQFYMYQNLQDKLLLQGAVAWEVTPWLSVGGGVQILADLVGHAELNLNVLNGSFRRTDLSVELQPSTSPMLGVHLRPARGLAIGLTWRGSTSLSFDLPVLVTEGEALALAIEVAQTVLWAPDQLTFGVSYEVDDLDLLVTTEATYAQWSRAPDPSPRLSADFSGGLVDALGLGQAIDISTRANPVELGFVDTLVGRVGVEWRGLPWLRARGGYFFRPTPAPRQTGWTAYLDNDAHVVSGGVGFVFDDPLEVHPNPVEVDLAAQWTVLARRTLYRDDPRDPVGDMSHGGSVLTFSVALSHRY